ncbi:MAG: hypothetical protein LBG74_00390 [Spirochaetaceae bacterium]|jgi:hypothetical protein|nr:hypothetical protein [Spirochaetaceae bacterium]
MKLDIRSRRFVFRAALVIVWFFALALLFVNARGHILLVDNAGKDEYSAFSAVKVSVNGEKPLAFNAGDRDRFFVSGSKAHIKIEAGRGETHPSLPFETDIRLPLRPDALLLSLPRLAAGVNALEVFNAAAYTPEEKTAAAEDAPIPAETGF